jgi:RHS repeat-associated protein
VHTDQINGSNIVTDSSGNVVESLDYYPYGSARLDTKVGSYVGEKRKYAGTEYDVSSGLNYMQARYQNPTRGAFISEDPSHLAIGDAAQVKAVTGQDQPAYLADPQQLNSYSYARDNPVAKSDPTGRNPFLIVGAAAYAASVTWDLGSDIYSNLRNSSIPWYAKLTPQDPDAAIRYNRDAFGSAAVAMAATAAEFAAAPLVAANFVTEVGAKVIGASAAGSANAALSAASGAATDPSTGRIDPARLALSFGSGFLAARIGQQIPVPPGRPPVTVGASLGGARAATEQLRAQVDQLAGALSSYLRAVPKSS